MQFMLNDTLQQLLGSIVVSIPACHAGDRGSIPRRGEHSFFFTLERVYDLSHAFISFMSLPFPSTLWISFHFTFNNFSDGNITHSIFRYYFKGSHASLHNIK